MRREKIGSSVEAATGKRSKRVEWLEVGQIDAVAEPSPIAFSQFSSAGQTLLNERS
jgi:hypothetical protein